MTPQRNRHRNRQPIEETTRLAIADLIGGAGDVDVERHGNDRGPDDLLLRVRLREPVFGSTLSLLRRQLWDRMYAIVPRGGECEYWLVVVQCKGNDLTTVSSYTKQEEFDSEYGET